jgi:hypothetical protein
LRISATWGAGTLERLEVNARVSRPYWSPDGLDGTHRGREQMPVRLADVRLRGRFDRHRVEVVRDGASAAWRIEEHDGAAGVVRRTRQCGTQDLLVDRVVGTAGDGGERTGIAHEGVGSRDVAQLE